jgi:hypothetical protein
MIYKMLHKLNSNDTQIFARIDDDGLCRVTCVAENHEFQAYLKNGGELQDADGNVMTQEQANEFINTLP